MLTINLAVPSMIKLARYSKTCVKQPLSKRLKLGFQDQLSLNAGQKYCRMLQREHSAILLVFIKLPFEQPHEISNNVVCATSKASDQSAHTRSLINAFASGLNIL